MSPTLRLYTPLRDIQHRKIRRILTLANRWAVDFFGPNTRARRRLKIFISYDADDTDMGEYYWTKREMTLYVINCGNLKYLIETFIHEYTHSLQSAAEYFELEKNHVYSKHPRERQAVRNAKYAKECWKRIKNQI